MTKTKREKCGNQRNFYINLHVISASEIEFTARYNRADARGSADIIYRVEGYRYFVGQAWLSTSESRSRREYL